MGQDLSENRRIFSSDAPLATYSKPRRKEMGLTLQELAERSELSAAFLSQAERRQSDTVNSVADQYRQSARYRHQLLPDAAGSRQASYGAQTIRDLSTSIHRWFTGDLTLRFATRR